MRVKEALMGNASKRIQKSKPVLTDFKGAKAPRSDDFAKKVKRKNG
jgi:hypothetical protein